MPCSTIKVKEGNTHSIAHFYRPCQVWPRLDQYVTLAPAARPLMAQVAKSLFMGGSGKVRLTTQLHRLNWVAGQRCYVKIKVDNNCKKTVNRITLALIRTTSVSCSQRSNASSYDLEEQTTTTNKVVAIENIDLMERERGQAGASGWISAGLKSFTLVHYVIIPVRLSHSMSCAEA